MENLYVQTLLAFSKSCEDRKRSNKDDHLPVGWLMRIFFKKDMIVVLQRTFVGKSIRRESDGLPSKMPCDISPAHLLRQKELFLLIPSATSTLASSRVAHGTLHRPCNMCDPFTK